MSIAAQKTSTGTDYTLISAATSNSSSTRTC